MRTVTYKSVQDRANLLFAGKISATTDDAASLNQFINSRYREFYEFFYWPEWTTTERRTFRQPYSGTTAYAETAEVYYWPPTAYYQALRSPLLTLTSLTRAANTATATFAAGHGLTTGSTFRVTIAGASPSGFNGTWTATVTSATQFTYLMPADPGGDGTGTISAGINPSNLSESPVNAYWAASEADYAGKPDWSAAAAYVVGNQVYQPLNGYFYQAHTANTNQAPPNPTYWGRLTQFQRDIDYEGGTISNQGTTATSLGEVKKIWDSDPLVNELPNPIAFDVTDTGLIVKGTANVVWVQFRLRANSFTGNTWASGAYSVGDQVYYTTTGEYYRCIATVSGQAPTDTTKWVKLDFPYVLAMAVAQAAYADLLKVTGKSSKWQMELKEAYRLLQREWDKVERQQGQTQQLNVMVR